MAYTKDIGLRDFYDYYVKTAKRKGIAYLDYKEYSKVLKDANHMLRDNIVYKSAIVTLPYRLGTLGIKKFENSYTEDNEKSWKIDFKATKLAGYKVYFGAQYGYRWYWNKRRCMVNGRRWYSFKPCRTASRMVADAINNKRLDFCGV